jgi:anhydro-N-acetylmuramic acid kinase
MAPHTSARPRRIAGVMSGTSLDGIDVALVTLTGSGRMLELSGIEHSSQPYPDAIREALLRVSQPETSSVLELSQLNVRLAHLYAEAIRHAMQRSADASPVELVGIHGQTVHHVPEPVECCGQLTRSTLQIGDPSTLANLLNVAVVGDFRMADMALGGQGAPLVPYFDLVALSSPTERRLALNLGGIANFTVLPTTGGDRGKPTAMDTGPANMVADALAERYLGRRYDEGGSVAATGRANVEVVKRLLEGPYFQQAPPKSTGREQFGRQFADHLVELLDASGTSAGADALATAVELTARSVVLAYNRFVPEPVNRVIASGGGTRNAFLMRRLGELFAPVPVETIDDHGIPSQAKEAVCFAVLAHEFLNGAPTNVPAVTGASAYTRLGKLCLPPNGALPWQEAIR